MKQSLTLKGVGGDTAYTGGCVSLFTVERGRGVIVYSREG